MKKTTEKLIISLLLVSSLVIIFPSVVSARRRIAPNRPDLTDRIKTPSENDDVQDWERLRNQWSNLNNLKKQINTQVTDKEARFLSSSKKRFTKFVNRLIKYLVRVQNRVVNNDNIDDDLKAQIIADINNRIDWLKAKKTEIDQAQDLEELKAIVQEIRTYWQTNKLQVKAKAIQASISRSYRVIERLEQLIEKIEEKIELLKQAGYDTSQSEALLEEARTSLEQARQEYEQAEQIILNLSTDDLQTDLQTARQHFKTAATYLRTSIQKIKTAIRLLKIQQPL